VNTHWQVRRVKNRLDPLYDAVRESAGYRDVCVLLSLEAEAGAEAGAGVGVGGQARDFDSVGGSGGGSSGGDAGELSQGLSRGFVCELQLQWRPLYSIKSADGHARYVQYRNDLAD
jgi:hypothetical protein